MCYRCRGLTVRDRFEDVKVGMRAIEGYKCVNCGAYGDLPNASWRQQGVSPHRVQVGGEKHEPRHT